MNKTIRPFCSTSVLLLFVCLLFPIISIVLLVFSFINGFSEKHLIFAALGFVLSFLIAKPLILTLLSSKIVLKENSFIIHYFEDLKTFNKNNLFKFPKYKSIEIDYSDVTKYGVFKSIELKKDGRDEQNRKIFLFYNNGIAIPVIIPKMIDDLQELIVFNDSCGASIVLDAKMFSKKQIVKVFDVVEKKSGKMPLQKIVKNNLPSCFLGGTMIGLICLGVFIGYRLIALDKLIIPSHDGDYNSPFRIMYMLGPAFSAIGVGGLLACKFNGGEKTQLLSSVASAKKLFIAVIIGGIVATVVGFSLSVLE